MFVFETPTLTTMPIYYRRRAQKGGYGGDIRVKLAGHPTGSSPIPFLPPIRNNGKITPITPIFDKSPIGSHGGGYGGGYENTNPHNHHPASRWPGAGNRALLGVAPPLSHAVTRTHGFRPPLARPTRSGGRSMMQVGEGPTVGSERGIGIHPKAPPLPSGFSGRRARRETAVPPYRRSPASTNFGKCVSPFSDWRHTSVRAPRYPVPIKRPFLDPLSVREGPRKDLILYVLNFLRVLPPIRAVPGRSGSFRGGHGRLNAPGARPSASFKVLPSIFAGGT